MALAALAVLVTLTFALPSDNQHQSGCFEKTVLFKAKSHGGSAGKVVFNNVLTNVGKGYNSRTGYFTAPVRGLYVFTVQGYSNGTGTLGWNLFVLDSTGSTYEVKSKDLTKLNLGIESLYVESLAGGHKVFVHNTYFANLATVFSGWLMKQF